MLLAIVLVVVTVAVVGLLVAPLTRSTRALPARGRFDRAVYRDQLEELEREIARGLIEPREAATARLEIERRLLAAEAADEAGERATPRPAPSPVLAIALAIAVPAAAALLYLYQGSPTLPGVSLAAQEASAAALASAQDGAARMSPEERQETIRGMIDRLAARLATQPDDADGWARLARAYDVFGKHDKALDAYEHAARLEPDNPTILLGEAEAMMPDRRPETPVPRRAVDLLRHVVELEPTAPAPLWYLGLAAAQQQHFDEALSYWRHLLMVLPLDSGQRKIVAAAIDALKGK